MSSAIEPIPAEDLEDVEYMKDFVSRRVAAERLNVTVSGLLRYEKMGLVHAVKGEDGVHRILLADVEMLLANGGIRQRRAYTRKRLTVKQEIRALRDRIDMLHRQVLAMRRMLNFEGRFAAEMAQVLQTGKRAKR